jgi:hypothetical protein
MLDSCNALPVQRSVNHDQNHDWVLCNPILRFCCPAADLSILGPAQSVRASLPSPMIRIAKPKTQRAKRALEKRSSKVVENTKKSLVLKGSKTSDLITHALKDLVRW